MRKEPLFLTAAEVLSFHSYQIQRFGGEEGIRDVGLLESALAQPCVSYDGNWLHKDLYEMASAYAFHICKNHPFLDGNKRTAFVSALVFLKLNGIFVSDPKEKLPEAIENIAKNIFSKADFAELLRVLTKSS